MHALEEVLSAVKCNTPERCGNAQEFQTKWGVAMTGYLHLSYWERQEIARFCADGWSLARIAAAIGWGKCTVSRELKRNSNMGGCYNPSSADRRERPGLGLAGHSSGKISLSSHPFGLDLNGFNGLPGAIDNEWRNFAPPRPDYPVAQVVHY